jgi:hypothetical protein
MANSELDFQLVVDRTIELTEICIAEGVIGKENAANSLRIALKDLQSRGASPPVLEKLEAYQKSLMPFPAPSK